MMEEQERFLVRRNSEPIPGPAPTLEGLRLASRRRTGQQAVLYVSVVVLLILAFYQYPAETPPEIQAADLLAALDDVTAASTTAEAPPGTEILPLFDPPAVVPQSNDPLLGDWSL